SLWDRYLAYLSHLLLVRPRALACSHPDSRTPLILRRPFLATRRALMDSKKREIMFRVKNESITFKVGKGYLFPIGVGDIFVVNIEKSVDETEHTIFASPKRKKAKLKWVKQYLCGTKNRKWVRKSRPKDGSPCS
ncbi:hypothetical protein HAX54_047528, partial [Datura stramonium]|nr:hypothetical protein [Datura stramonium]